MVEGNAADEYVCVGGGGGVWGPVGGGGRNGARRKRRRWQGEGHQRGHFCC